MAFAITYPFGLVGEEIPLLARIISVADTYDALTQTRPYRKGRSISAAMEEIRRVRGTQLDPEVLNALEKLVPFLEQLFGVLQEESARRAKEEWKEGSAKTKETAKSDAADTKATAKDKPSE